MAGSRKITHGPEAQAQILEAVDELFYREGARAVGVEAVVNKAGLSKMALYRQFESKEALLMHYLERRDVEFWDYINNSLDQHPGDARAALKQIYIDLAARAIRPAYRGCPFVNIAAEFPDREHPARRFVAENKARVIEKLRTLSAAAGAADPNALAAALALLLEGAYAASQTYDSAESPLAALPETAETLIGAAVKAAGAAKRRP